MTLARVFPMRLGPLTTNKSLFLLRKIPLLTPSRSLIVLQMRPSPLMTNRSLLTHIRSLMMIQIPLLLQCSYALCIKNKVLTSNSNRLWVMNSNSLYRIWLDQVSLSRDRCNPSKRFNFAQTSKPLEPLTTYSGNNSPCNSVIRILIGYQKCSTFCKYVITSILITYSGLPNNRTCTKILVLK